jgi:hypothetical protein
MDWVMGQNERKSAMRFGVLLVLAAWLAAPANAQKWANDMFAETTHDFGKVPVGSNTQFVFEFTNGYRETVHVASVRSTCGCTIPSVLDATVQSRQKGRILAVFNTKSFLGPRAAAVTVVFDKPFYAEVQLNVAGEILSDVSISPAEVAFGQVTSGEEHVSQVKVAFLNRPNLLIEDVRSLSDDLRVRLSGPIKTAGKVEYALKVTLKDTVQPGELGERLTLVTNDPSCQNVVVSVSGKVRPQVEVKPEAVHFASVQSGKVASERLLLRGDSEFSIEKIDCDDDRFSFKYPETAAKIHFVQMTFTADDSVQGEFKVPVRIVTNLGKTGAATCVVTGMVPAASVVAERSKND